MAGKKGMKHYHYPEELKLEAVRMHLEEGITSADVMKQLDINSRARLLAWCEAYRKYGLVGLKAKPKGRPGKMPKTPQETLEYELKRLKMENELLRNFLYEAGRR